MATLTPTADQVIELVRKLSAADQARVRDILRREAISRRWNQPSAHLQQRVREMASQRKCNWDTMTEQEQESFLDNILHEDD